MYHFDKRIDDLCDGWLKYLCYGLAVFSIIGALVVGVGIVWLACKFF